MLDSPVACFLARPSNNVPRSLTALDLRRGSTGGRRSESADAGLGFGLVAVMPDDTEFLCGPEVLIGDVVR